MGMFIPQIHTHATVGTDPDPLRIALHCGDFVFLEADYHMEGQHPMIKLVGDGRCNGHDHDGNCIISVPESMIRAYFTDEEIDAGEAARAADTAAYGEHGTAPREVVTLRWDKAPHGQRAWFADVTKDVHKPAGRYLIKKERRSFGLYFNGKHLGVTDTLEQAQVLAHETENHTLNRERPVVADLMPGMKP